ncbi:DUF4867 family protein [uncultured Oscillibacter sp.]|uniref:DUF4867 family protein n=1 Tax=uncultured Oscillibacter sp. TaxID=876091 RepID=UPI0028039D60|nr:DUF4867 family protein [uncultured Oscillibacter sp.]
MTILPISDPAFASYGKILEGYDTQELLRTLEAATPLPQGVEYVPSQPELEALPLTSLLASNAYGGMPIQMGWCNGHNTKLNCLEYHRDSELNCGTEDFILLLARMDDIAPDGTLDTGLVKAFRVPAGVLVEVYATTLHYAPCSAAKGAGFRVLVALPKGTNGPRPDIQVLNREDSMLWACNKWLLAHPESSEAAQGAPAVLRGENIDIAADV